MASSIKIEAGDVEKERETLTRKLSPRAYRFMVNIVNGETLDDLIQRIARLRAVARPSADRFADLLQEVADTLTRNGDPRDVPVGSLFRIDLFDQDGIAR